MDKIFIEQAKHIRREYIKNIKNIANCENKIEFYKTQLDEIRSDLHSNLDKDIIFEKLAKIELNIKEIEKIISPYSKKVVQLEKDADTLYENIKERHRNLTSEQIKEELTKHLIEIKF